MTETEADTRANRIDPVLREAGWGVVEGSKIRREMICPGRITGGGRVNPLSADYVLSYRDRKLAVIEAKRAGLGHTDGVGQAKDYATRLKARFAYSTNGLGWYGIDMATGTEGDHALPFPSPQELWGRCFPEGNDWRDRFGAVPFEAEGGKWEPRYYQHNAITAVLEAIVRGRERILLTLATGTGKTSIAFQIAWKLYHASWNLSRDPARRPRILFLADRNILADQAYNSFSAFPPDALCRISPDEIRKQGKIPKNANIFFTIFQTFMTGTGEFTFQGYPKDFFDFIVIDECHRGGAKDESTWRGILEYFAPAVQLGLTATPKRDVNADTYGYFGDPVYTYALKEGIGDGFLTPFKVRQMASTMDTYRLGDDDEVVSGEIDPDREYTEADFNTKLVIDERELSRVHEFMDQIDQRQKTLVFCATQDHAARVRNFINQVKDNPDPHYCERVTADDGKLGEQHLREFQDNEKTLPTILVTSHKLSTGVDARNIRNIVLLRPIKSMIEFKQIVGRGTRTFDGKDFFTVYDFVKAYEHFSDPKWDGEPLPPDAPGPKPPAGPPPEPPEPGPDDGTPGSAKIVVKLADGKDRQIRYIAATTYWSHDGRPITAQEFMAQLFGDLGALVASEDELRQIWSNPERREGFIERLTELGYDSDRMEDLRRLIDAPNSDIFDVLAYVRFTLAPLARAQRAGAARSSGLGGYEFEMRQFLDYVLQAYEVHGVEELSLRKIRDIWPVAAGENVLGIIQKERQLHSITSAARETGIGPFLLEQFLVHAGAITSDDDRPASRTIFEAKAYADLLAEIPTLVGPKQMQQQMGATRRQLASLAEDNVLSPRIDIPTIKLPWRVSDGLALVAELQEMASSIDPTDIRWEGIQQAKSRSGLRVGTIIAAIRARRLRIGRREDLRGYAGFSVLKSEIDGLKPSNQEQSVTPVVSAAVFGRSVGMRTNGWFEKLYVTGHTPATRMPHPKFGGMHVYLTQADVAAFHKRFLTSTTMEREFAQHKRTLLAELRAAHVRPFTPNDQDFGAIYLREEVEAVVKPALTHPKNCN